MKITIEGTPEEITGLFKGGIKNIEESGEQCPCNKYARFFDRDNPLWAPDAKFNKFILEQAKLACYSKLRETGCLSLGEVYERLWFPEKDCKKEVNQKVGWIFKDDNCYFDIFDVHELYGDPEEPIYLLIFNVKDNLSE